MKPDRSSLALINIPPSKARPDQTLPYDLNVTNHTLSHLVYKHHLSVSKVESVTSPALLLLLPSSLLLSSSIELIDLLFTLRFGVLGLVLELVSSTSGLSRSRISKSLGLLPLLVGDSCWRLVREELGFSMILFTQNKDSRAHPHQRGGRIHLVGRT